VEIEEPGGRRITNVEGRTIKPDGAIVELKKDGIFDRELAKTKNTKVRGKTFRLPNVEVGDIIEYPPKSIAITGWPGICGSITSAICPSGGSLIM
jgi:hypothetical protein